MNKVILMGRLTHDPEVRYSQGAQGTAVCRYSLAVNRSYKREGELNVDFINVASFGNRGEFAGKYFKKGMMVAVVGELRINSYTDKNGNKRWSTAVIAAEQYFAESKAAVEGRSQGGSCGYSSTSQPSAFSYQQADGFIPIDDEIDGDEDLPF